VISAWLCHLDGLLGPGQNHDGLSASKDAEVHIPSLGPGPNLWPIPPRETDKQGRENLGIHKPWSGEKRFLNRVFKTEVLKKAFLAKLREFNGKRPLRHQFPQYVSTSCKVTDSCTAYSLSRIVLCGSNGAVFVHTYSVPFTSTAQSDSLFKNGVRVKCSGDDAVSLHSKSLAFYPLDLFRC
jgi:hypothetical protein